MSGAEAEAGGPVGESWSSNDRGGGGDGGDAGSRCGGYTGRTECRNAGEGIIRGHTWNFRFIYLCWKCILIEIMTV